MMEDGPFVAIRELCFAIVVGHGSGVKESG